MDKLQSFELNDNELFERIKVDNKKVTLGIIKNKSSVNDFLNRLDHTAETEERVSLLQYIIF